MSKPIRHFWEGVDTAGREVRASFLTEPPQHFWADVKYPVVVFRVRTPWEREPGYLEALRAAWVDTNEWRSAGPRDHHRWTWETSMKIDDILDVSKLAKHVADGEIRVRRHFTEPLSIYNYSSRCQYEKIWTHETKTCRGLIVHDSGEVVARPFQKFFNLGEHPEAPPIHEPHSIYEKLDGSLGIAYVKSDGKTAISIRGAFHSPQAEHATEWLQKNHPTWIPPSGETWLFEIIFPGSRVVVDYGESDQLVLLTRIDNETQKEPAVPDDMWTGMRARRYDISWGEMLLSQKNLKGLLNEGFVIHFHHSGLRLKAKTEDYTRLHRLVCGLSTRAVWEVLSTGASFDEFLSAVPDEFMEWVKAKATELREKFTIIEKASRAVAERAKERPDRKAQAEYIKANADEGHAAVCFKMLGGQRGDVGNHAPVIWKLVYPEHETFRTVNEDVS